MNTENLPTIAPKDYGDVKNSNWPILSLNSEIQGAHRLTPHSHPRGQLIYPINGTYWVVTPVSSWVLPAKQALWIPPHLHHDVFSNNTAHAYVFFIDETYTAKLPNECSVLSVSALLREMFVKVTANDNIYSNQGNELRLIECMLDELNEMQRENLSLPMALDKRLLTIMHQLIENPAEDKTFEQLADNCGASIRTLSRLFKSEVGLSFSEWRKHLRLLHAIELLQQGRPVNIVAMDLGYSSVSAFIAMFHRALGVSPGQYSVTASTN